VQRVSEHAYARQIVAEVRTAVAKGWGRDEVAERVSFFDRFPIEQFSRSLAPQGHKLSILHLYDVVTLGEEKARPLPL